MGEAQDYFTRALTLTENLDDIVEQARMWWIIAGTQIGMSATDEARDTLRTAWGHLKKSVTEQKVSGFTLNRLLGYVAEIVGLQRQLGMSTEIEEAIQAAKTLAEAEPKPTPLFDLFSYDPDSSLAQILAKAGRTKEAFEMAEKLPAGMTRTVTLKELCAVQIAMGEIQQARRTIDLVSPLESVEMLTGLTVTRPEYMAEVKTLLDQIEAEAMAKQPIGINQQDIVSFALRIEKVARSLTRLASAQAERGQRDAAHRDLAKALDLATKPHTGTIRAHVCRGIAEAYWNAGFQQEARNLIGRLRQDAINEGPTSGIPKLFALTQLQIRLRLVEEAQETLKKLSVALKEFNESPHTRVHHSDKKIAEMQERYQGYLNYATAMLQAKTGKETQALALAEKLQPPDQIQLLAWMAKETT